MIILNPSTDSLEIVTSAAGEIDYVISYADHTATGVTLGSALGKITSATTTTAVSAPGVGVTRQVRGVMIANVSKGVKNTITVQIDESGTNRKIAGITLDFSLSLHYTDSDGWKSLSSTGRQRKISFDLTPFTYPVPFYKVGVNSEAGGVYHSQHAATGTPGAWLPGAPGAAGRATYGSETADNGCLEIRTPTSGSSAYLQAFNCGSSRNNTTYLFDVVWVNTGLNVTTTTAQTVDSVKFPPRDNHGSSDGEGYEIGILVTTATTSGVVTNSTISYTNSAGVSGRTARITSLPGSAVAGTFVPFTLQDGDIGVMSIQSVTLGTSYGGGAISVIVYRKLAVAASTSLHIPSSNFVDRSLSKIWPGTCAIIFQAPSVLNAAVIQGIALITEK